MTTNSQLDFFDYIESVVGKKIIEKEYAVIQTDEGKTSGHMIFEYGKIFKIIRIAYSIEAPIFLVFQGDQIKYPLDMPKILTFRNRRINYADYMDVYHNPLYDKIIFENCIIDSYYFNNIKYPEKLVLLNSTVSNIKEY